MAQFEIPKSYDFEKAFSKTFGIMKGKPFSVKAEFTGTAAIYVAERVWSPDQQIEWNEEGEKLRIRFGASFEDEAISWILSYEAYGRLLGPDLLLKKAGERLGRIGQRYTLLDIAQ